MVIMITVIATTMFMVLSSWQYTANARVHPVHLTSAAQALGGHRPLDQATYPPKLAAVALH